ncbi:MAG: (d)CMP kinase [Chloroflexi bacterium]|nr:(d)CMP kinase [Chloroflexota bacterium]
MERLQKVLARAGVGSRRACEELITGGLVAVDGAIVKELGTKVDPAKAHITVRGRPISAPPELVHIMLNKPPGYISTAIDTHGRRTVLHLVPTNVRLFPVGRLDFDSEGLILLTNDGPWANCISHPRFQVEKEYEVLVSGRPSEADLAKLRQGVHLEDGLTAPAEVEISQEAGKATWLRFVIHEGRKRQIRRMLAVMGYDVQRLVRVRIGSLQLGNLPRGSHRELTAKEVADLGCLAGLGWPSTVAIDGPGGVGKSTIGQRLAEELGYLFFDTGVMYRALALSALRKGISPGDEQALSGLANSMCIDLTEPTVADGRQYTVLLDGEDVTWDIRRPDVDATVSEVSVWPSVRTALVSQQRALAARGRVVMVGRDVGTVVLPDADLKIFLSAGLQTRAERRYQELLQRGEQPDFSAVLSQLQHRDTIDSTREVSPLRPADDAVIVDTEGKPIEEVLRVIRRVIEKSGVVRDLEE